MPVDMKAKKSDICFERHAGYAWTRLRPISLGVGVESFWVELTAGFNNSPFRRAIL
jgi:hypothetical protein